MVTAWLTYFFVVKEYQELSEQSLSTLEEFLLSQKRQELKNYIAISISTIPELQPGEEPSQETRERVAQGFNQLLYGGDDGYFFVYTGDGTSIAHPKEPFRVGNNFYHFEDIHGNKVIKELIETSQNGGGFYRYAWNKPSTKIPAEKLSYSVYLQDWDWMIGTGLYLDDINNQLSLLQKKMNNHISNTRSVILVVAMSSLLSIFLFALISNWRHKQQTDLKITELGQRIITMQEEERRHISRELHDGIIQIMVSIKYAIEATKMHLKQAQQTQPAPLQLAQDNLDIAISEIRRISHHLHPKMLDELGLGEALQNLAAEFSARTAINVTTSKLAVSKLLPDDISTTLYRVAQESLTNIEKHADATKVHIALFMKGGWLTLSITDNGCGFKADDLDGLSGNGIGLRNLQERVEYQSGVFMVSSAEDGTTIIAKIPKEKFHRYYQSKAVEKSEKGTPIENPERGTPNDA